MYSVMTRADALLTCPVMSRADQRGPTPAAGGRRQIWHLGVLAGAAEFYVALRAYVAYRAAHTCAAQ